MQNACDRETRHCNYIFHTFYTLTTFLGLYAVSALGLFQPD